MNRSLRILMPTSVFPRWKDDATPGFVLNLATDLVQSGHQVLVIAPHSNGAQTRETVEGVSVIRYKYAYPSGLQTLCYEGGMLVRMREKPLRKLLLPFLALSQFCAIKKTIATFKPDLVHAHSLLPQAWICAKALLKRHDIPLVTSSHGNDVFGLHGRYAKHKRFAAGQSRRIIANSAATSKVLASFCEDSKIVQIPASPNEIEKTDAVSIESLRERLGGENSKLICFAGRLIPEKGIDMLVEILPRVLEKHPDVKLLICGEGPLKSRLEKRVGDLGLARSVSFLGWIPSEKIPSYFAASDLVAIPSQPQKSGWEEAQGLVAVEAMAMGKPVIASRLGGLGESIVHEQSGFLVEPENREAWINSICALLASNESEKIAMGNAARNRYDAMFSRKTVCDKTIQLYIEALSI